MADVKLAKNSRIARFPSQSGSVKAAMERAINKAKEQKWSKVVVIGQGKNGGHFFHSRMNTHDLIGFMEDVRYLVMRDNFG